MTIEINDLEPGDVGAIDQIAAMILAAWPDWKENIDEARYEVGDSFEEGHLSLVARAGDRVLGWIGAIPTYDYAWELHPLVVREDARGLGVGTALVTAL